MLITEISYERVKNLGNYESERFSMRGIPAEGEKVETCVETLKLKVEQALGLVPAEKPKTAAKEKKVAEKPKTAAKEKKVAEKPKTAAKEKKVEKEETKKEEAAEAEEPKKTRGRPKKEKVISADDVRKELQAFAKEHGREAGFEILEEFGAKKVIDIKEEDLAKVIERLNNATF